MGQVRMAFADPRFLRQLLVQHRANPLENILLDGAQTMNPPRLVPIEVAEARRAICVACENRIPLLEICKACDCRIHMAMDGTSKVGLARHRCPLNPPRWDFHQADQKPDSDRE